jgi:hypothetical protein
LYDVLEFLSEESVIVLLGDFVKPRLGMFSENDDLVVTIRDIWFSLTFQFFSDTGWTKLHNLMAYDIQLASI